MAILSIPLHSRKYPGLFATVDEEDYLLVSQYRWGVRRPQGTKTAYAVARLGDGTRLLMHRVILRPSPEKVVDHRDGNGLNNCRSNLREATIAENVRNASTPVNNVSGYKGVSVAPDGRYGARIGHMGVHYHLGYFGDAESAARAYDMKARELFGEFARQNFPGDDRPAPIRVPVRVYRNNTSGFRGVSRAGRKWKANLRKNDTTRYFGIYSTPEEAARVYDAHARQLLGDAAILNFPEDTT